MKRKLTVTITTSRRQVITVPAAVLRVHCPFCEREVETVSQAQAAELLIIAGRRLDDLIASTQTHSIPSASDDVRICKDSLCFG